MDSDCGALGISRYFAADQGFGECAVCLCQWKEALEAVPCRHIYCKECIEGLSECPECCTEIVRLQEPNSALLELQRRAKGKCSTCGWAGTYAEFLENHATCTVTPGPATVTKPDGEVAIGRVGCEYFLELSIEEFDKNGCNVGLQQEQRRQKEQQGSSQCSAAFVTNSLRVDPVAVVPQSRIDKWKEEISCTASDYGLKEEEFNFLKDRWMDFATLNEGNNTPELRWRDACRLLRYMNLPSHSSDVMGLFHMAMQSLYDGALPFHVLCLWLPMSRRDPNHWYKMDEKKYASLLKYAQIIDVEKTGLFNEEQCKQIGEQMLSRDLTPLEWQSIRPLVLVRAEEFRRSIPFAQTCTIPRDQLVKLPLHDIILLYNTFFDPKKKSTVTGLDEEWRSTLLRERIRRVLMHYNPAALASIEDTLEEFKGQEETLLRTLIEVYGPESK